MRRAVAEPGVAGPATKRPRHWPEDFAATLHSAYSLAPGDRRWQSALQGGIPNSAVGDNAGGLLLSFGRKLAWLTHQGSRELVLDSHSGQCLLGCTAPECPDGHAAIVYEQSTGQVSRCPLAAWAAGAPSSTLQPMMTLSAPYPEKERLAWYGGSRLAFRKHPNQLQILRPATASGQQEVERSIESSHRGCPEFSVGSIVARPSTGDVYFLDRKRVRLYCWSQAGQVTCAKELPEVALRHGGRLQLGPDFLLASWKALKPPRRMLRIELPSLATTWLELLEESGSLWAPAGAEQRLLSSRLLFVLEPAPTLAGVIRCADLGADELASQSARDLHTIDWASPSDLIRFRTVGGAAAAAAGPERGAGGEREEVLSVDRRILCARSAYFRAMFGSGMQEATTGVVDLPPEVRVAAFRCLVDYLHTDLIDPLRAVGHPGVTPAALPTEVLRECTHVCMEVVKLADVYQLPRLHKLAELFVHLHGLSVSTVLQLLVRAHTFGAEGIEEACLQFVLDHSKELKRTRDWELAAVVRKETAVAYKLLMRCL